MNRARAYRYKRDCDKAISDLTEHIRLSPDRAAAYRERSKVYRAKGELEKAEKALDK
jgi:hypothetical protein